MKRTYICEISSNSSYPRYYEVETRSALKCARKYGRGEGDEIVTVYGNKAMTTILSCAMWSVEKRAYFRAIAPLIDYFKAVL